MPPLAQGVNRPRSEEISPLRENIDKFGQNFSKMKIFQPGQVDLIKLDNVTASQKQENEQFPAQIALAQQRASV
jgi:hypothetical protein